MPTLNELAAALGGQVRGDGSREIKGVAAVEEAGPEDITFITDERFLPSLEKSRAGAVLIGPGKSSGRMPAIVTADPRQALPLLLERFAPAIRGQAPGVAPSAVVDPTARLEVGASVGPLAVVEASAEIGEGAVIGSLCFVGADARIGAGSRIAPLAVIGERTEIGARVIVHSGAVLGADGFGFMASAAGPRKVPQIGRVVIEDDVEIGANCTIDRATVGATLVKRGAKLDNQVHIAHNCVIGEGAVVAGQTGFSGSVAVGRGARFGGQVGVADHVTIGDGAQVGAQSGVHRDVKAGESVFGYPARPAREAAKINGVMALLPALMKRVRELEAKVKELGAGKRKKRARRAR